MAKSDSGMTGLIGDLGFQLSFTATGNKSCNNWCVGAFVCCTCCSQVENKPQLVTVSHDVINPDGAGGAPCCGIGDFIFNCCASVQNVMFPCCSDLCQDNSTAAEQARDNIFDVLDTEYKDIPNNLNETEQNRIEELRSQDTLDREEVEELLAIYWKGWAIGEAETNFNRLGEEHKEKLKALQEGNGITPLDQLEEFRVIVEQVNQLAKEMEIT